MNGQSDTAEMNGQSDTADLKEFDVIIRETLEKRVPKKARDLADAESIVGMEWKKEEHVLDSGNFVGVEFEAVLTDREITLDNGNNREGFEKPTANDSPAIIQDSIAAEPLMENGYVKEFLSILGTLGKNSSGLAALISYVDNMEKVIKRAEDNIADMKSQLDLIKEARDHPFRSKQQGIIKALEQKAAEIKEQLGSLKTQIIDGCKNAAAAFKEKGISALGSIASFFKVKDFLVDWRKDVHSAIRMNDDAISRIETFSKEYHSAGRHLKNMARVSIGKEPLDTVKENGKLSKAMSAPYKAHKDELVRLKSVLDRSVTKLEQLEGRRSQKKAEPVPDKKPSMLAKLAENKERVEQVKRETPPPERKKAKGMAV